MNRRNRKISRRSQRDSPLDSAPPRLVAINKPFGVLPQFSDEQGRPTLKDYVPVADIYPAGRLDKDSEGLMLLTNDGKLQARITNPRHKLPKLYWVQVEGIPESGQLEALRSGPPLKDGPTRPAEVSLIPPPLLWPRHPPIRERKTVPAHWLAITITEGRNRQVRRMTAAVGLPTLRLVRVAIGGWHLRDLQPGEWRDEQPTG